MTTIFLACAPFGLDCFWWWLFSLTAFLLGWLLYWLLFGQEKDRRLAALEKERDDYHDRATKWEADYNEIKYQLEECTKSSSTLRTNLQRCEADKAVLEHKLRKAEGNGGDTASGAAPLHAGGIVAAATGMTSRGAGKETDRTDYSALFEPDNLQIIEGIGPKTEGLLHKNEIRRWNTLARTSVEKLQQLLNEAGSRFQLLQPGAWPRQAQLADEGKWDELIEYQQFLSSSKSSSGQGQAKIQRLGFRALGFNNDPNDLKVVEGIGPKIEGLLKAAGIHTWSQLADTPVDRLQQVMNEAGERYRLANPETWPRQAGLASRGQWQELREYQGFLQSGNTPTK